MARHEQAILRGHLSASAFPSLVPAVRRVVAPNPGPYTGPGTNTWLVDAGPVIVVIDPGPDDDEHLAAINRALGGATVAVVLVTRSQPDHQPAADRLRPVARASVLLLQGAGAG